VIERSVVRQRALNRSEIEQIRMQRLLHPQRRHQKMCTQCVGGGMQMKHRNRSPARHVQKIYASLDQ
jgi:hypothetical protein